jgi:carboxymethylenebutenolidase
VQDRRVTLPTRESAAVHDISLPLLTVTPVEGGPRPAVVVLHEGYGITNPVIRTTERLAREGYLCVLPDLFFRTGGPESGEIEEMIGPISGRQLRADLTTSIEHLRALGATSIAVIGFCMGGSFAYSAAKWADTLGVDAAFSFYGSGIARQLGDPVCPIVMCFGAEDEWIPVEEAELVRERHGDDVVIYPGAGHGFMRDRTESWRDAAATDAWARMLALFAEHLH